MQKLNIQDLEEVNNIVKEIRANVDIFNRLKDNKPFRYSFEMHEDGTDIYFDIDAKDSCARNALKRTFMEHYMTKICVLQLKLEEQFNIDFEVNCKMPEDIEG